MGTFIHTLGNLNIPEDKQEAFITDARIVAEKGGLFSQSYTSIFGSRLWHFHFRLLRSLPSIPMRISLTAIMKKLHGKMQV